MSVLSWGKPKIEIAPFVNGVLPATPTWTVVTTPKEGTAKLTPTKGAKKEAKLEGGEFKDVKYAKNTFIFEFEIQLGRGETKPIEDEDGVVTNNYAVRLTPEDDTLQGYLMDKTAVTVEESWTSEDGSLVKYTFDVLKPATGKMVKPYTKA